MSRETTIHLGFEVGTGEPVSIPLAHTFVTGQTQLSGKTTTLQAIVVRSGRRALAFVTKRGEQFDWRRIQPYLPREGEQPIHWRLVETILASALGQRSMKYERFQLVNASTTIDEMVVRSEGLTALASRIIDARYGPAINEIALERMDATAVIRRIDSELRRLARAALGA